MKANSQIRTKPQSQLNLAGIQKKALDRSQEHVPSVCVRSASQFSSTQKVTTQLIEEIAKRIFRVLQVHESELTEQIVRDRVKQADLKDRRYLKYNMNNIQKDLCEEYGIKIDAKRGDGQRTQTNATPVRRRMSRHQNPHAQSNLKMQLKTKNFTGRSPSVEV